MVENIIWTPQPKQKEFMQRPEDEVLYGGAAGGGKSEALVCEALRQVHLPHYRAVIFRKTYKQLEEIISKSLRYYKAAYPKAKYNASEHTWTFPSGAKIYFRSMPNKMSYLDYQGQSYEFIGFDELTHFTAVEYDYLLSRNRANGEGSRVYIRSTANPGGIGHGWVKERFITISPPDTTTEHEVSVWTPTGETKMTLTRRFVPSSVFDNQILMNNDPKYVAHLGSMPDAQKRALLYGDWDVFAGQVFTEWRDNPAGYFTRKGTHVIEPFKIPEHWRRYRAYDFGYTKPFAVLWFAVDEDGRAYLYREFYGCKKDQPNVGIEKTDEWQAQQVASIEEQAGETEVYGVADPAIWGESKGPGNSVASAFEKYGVYFEKGDNRRILGKMQVHNRLAFDENGEPRLYVFNTCVNTIRTLPQLVYSNTHTEDVDTEGEDHIYDALRYFLMTVPIASEPPKKEEKKIWTPLGWI